MYYLYILIVMFRKKSCVFDNKILNKIKVRISIENLV